VAPVDPDDWLSDTQASYDTVAANYADLMRDSLAGARFVRSALAVFAEDVHAAGGGPVADMGCGPGHVTAHLRGLGLDCFGIDLSPAMVEIARREHPDARFDVGSMTDPELADGSVAGLLAFWSLIHIPDDELPGVLGHFVRVLRPGGPLLVGFHVGEGSRWKSEGYGGLPMRLSVHRRQPGAVAAALRAAGFAVEAQLLTEPDGERPGAMLFGRRPA
jgi:SAM-dependent methyltransferase